MASIFWIGLPRAPMHSGTPHPSLSMKDITSPGRFVAATKGESANPPLEMAIKLDLDHIA
jgi:hypothetical protein